MRPGDMHIETLTANGIKPIPANNCSNGHLGKSTRHGWTTRSLNGTDLLLHVGGGPRLHAVNSHAVREQKWTRPAAFKNILTLFGMTDHPDVDRMIEATFEGSRKRNALRPAISKCKEHLQAESGSSKHEALCKALAEKSDARSALYGRLLDVQRGTDLYWALHGQLHDAVAQFDVRTFDCHCLTIDIDAHDAQSARAANDMFLDIKNDVLVPLGISTYMDVSRGGYGRHVRFWVSRPEEMPAADFNRHVIALARYLKQRYPDRAGAILESVKGTLVYHEDNPEFNDENYFGRRRSYDSQYGGLEHWSQGQRYEWEKRRHGQTDKKGQPINYEYKSQLEPTIKRYGGAASCCAPLAGICRNIETAYDYKRAQDRIKYFQTFVDKREDAVSIADIIHALVSAS